MKDEFNESVNMFQMYRCSDFENVFKDQDYMLDIRYEWSIVHMAILEYLGNKLFRTYERYD